MDKLLIWMKILEICNKYNVPIIEDAAESLGATYKGKQTGTPSKYGIYSFNGNKIITIQVVKCLFLTMMKI